MSSPAVREIMSGPAYVGPVAGVKQEYDVYKTARGDFAVFSRSNRGSASFHVTFIPAARVAALREAIPPEGTSTGALLKDERVASTFDAEDRDVLYFEVLTSLYVLAALGDVEVTKSGRNLVFVPRHVSSSAAPSAPHDGASSASSTPRRRRRSS